MMLSKKNLATALAMSLGAAFSAHAGDDFSWRFSGFGTVGYTATNSDELLLVNPGQLKGAQKGGSGLVDSRLGGQLDFTFNPKWSATVQAIAMQDAKGRFSPDAEWAFVRYKPVASTSIRLGRLGWPAYQVSDFRYVGYANPWARAPLEVYGLAPLDYFEGADVSWSHDAGKGYFTLQGLGGHASTAYPSTRERAGRLKVNQLAGAYATLELDSLRLRAGASTGKVTFQSEDLATLLGGLRLAGLGGHADAIEADGARTTFISLGANYDADNILVTAEYAKLRSAAEVLGHQYGWYATFGYRLGKWTPYLTWAGFGKRDELARYGVPPLGPLLPLAEGMDGIVGGKSQHTTSLGVRADVTGNLAIKAQFDRSLPNARGGTFDRMSPAYAGKTVNVYSLVADFVF